ncbi:helix-turn-helix domain-containing protein [Anaerocolumna sp. MB42-C2]|uniref:helix-turn-helix domain-containing protein n=1 Tax=Anaerocolumna sp. MB42-C2 TaxID=3070997 RepID=UPI0027E21097|nr:helix-turn-helix domain-containing protein [Anaerocolumna sp. MB42-C2]WMJ89567.1 helix-turn-helix domain-containing protein [Anaerocolumna sp. MB42-C2]
MSELLLKDKLRELRTRMHLTQSKVGQYLNMTRQGYAHYEAGLRNPDYHTLLKLSKLYQVDIGDLINNHTTPITHETLHENVDYTIKSGNSKPNNTLSRVIQLTSDEKKLFNLYSKLNSTEKKELLAMLESKINETKKNNK